MKWPWQRRQEETPAPEGQHRIVITDMIGQVLTDTGWKLGKASDEDLRLPDIPGIYTFTFTWVRDVVKS